MHQCPLGKELYEEVKNGIEFKKYLADNMVKYMFKATSSLTQR